MPFHMGRGSYDFTIQLLPHLISVINENDDQVEAGEGADIPNINATTAPTSASSTNEENKTSDEGK